MSLRQILLLPTFIVLLTGCIQDDTQAPENESKNNQPIKYESQKNTNDNIEKDHKQYPDNKYKNVNEGDEQGQTDKYTNEVTQSLVDHLKKRQDIRQAQVAITDDKVVVGVMLTDQAPPDMRQLVEEEVERMMPTHDVQAYTDDIYWDRKRNKDAELDQLNGDMDEYLREFFNRDRKDFK